MILATNEKAATIDLVATAKLVFERLISKVLEKLINASVYPRIRACKTGEENLGVELPHLSLLVV